MLLEAQQAAWRPPPWRDAVRGGRRHRPGDHHGGRLGRAVHPPHRARHRHRGARGPVHRLGQRHPARAGHAFSIEPGIYVEGKFGFRLEDIVVATAEGPDELNGADHAFVRRRRVRTSPACDPPRRRDRPAPVGDGRAALPLGDHPPARGRPRLRLAAAGHLRPDGRSAPSSSASRYGEPVPVRDWAGVGVVLGTGLALAVSIQRRRAGVSGERERSRPAAPGWRR